MDNGKEKEIVFFIDKEQFKISKPQVAVRELLQDYANEDPNETTLVQRKGNDLHKYENLDEVITLENGMHFIVYHNGPTPVS